MGMGRRAGRRTGDTSSAIRLLCLFLETNLEHLLVLCVVGRVGPLQLADLLQQFAELLRHDRPDEAD